MQLRHRVSFAAAGLYLYCTTLAHISLHLSSHHSTVPTTAPFVTLSCVLIITNMSTRQIYALTLVDQMIRNLHSSKAGDIVSDVDDINLCYSDDGTLDIDRLEEFYERENDKDTA